MSNLARDYMPAVKYGAKWLLSDIAGAGISPYGTTYFVDADNGSNYNDGLTQATAFASVATGYAATTTNKDDILVLSTNSAHTITSMLTFSKSRVHVIGDQFGRIYGARAKIQMGVTTATSDVFAVKNIGIGNTFFGVKFYNDNTLTQNTACLGEGGEYALYQGCEMYDSTRLNSNTHAEMLLNGDSAQFFGCTFGSLADAVSGNVVRPAVITTGGGVANSLSGGTSRDIYFDKCHFWKKAGGVNTAMIKIAANGELERVMELHDCQFVASVQGSVPDVAIASATLTSSQVILTGDTAAFNCTKIATATGVISGLNVKVATATIGIQAT